MESYRVFISYSHEDAPLAADIVRTLEENGLTPLWDQQLSFGRGFDAQIQTFIAHSHVFVPLITPSSSARGWVHQEIGYAMALRVPVLPVCQGKFPGEMLQMLHAISLEEARTLTQQLAHDVFENLVANHAPVSRPLYECAMLAEERSALIAQYADQVRQIAVGSNRAHGCVRQKAALGSFCVPNKNLNHPSWRQREGRLLRSEHRRAGQLAARKALERHAKVEGCRLILSPWLDCDSQYGPGATYVRLQTLVAFLESLDLPADKVEVAFRPNGAPHSVTIVGDWFLAEAVAAVRGAGYRQTMFTRHAPTVRQAVAAFDQEFVELLEESGIAPASSRDAAIAFLKERMDEFPAPD